MADKSRLQQKLEELKEEYSKTSYNKATNKHLGLLRAKIAVINKQLTEKKGKKGLGFAVKKSGDATVVLVGFPNAGKSSLLNLLTGVESRVADYAFTTLDVIPGTLNYEGAKIQVLDLPGLIEGAHIGKGGGAQIASVIRIADLILFVVDVTSYKQLFTLADELAQLDMRINKGKPPIRVEEKRTGGLMIEAKGHKIPETKLLQSVLNEFGVFNASVIFYADSNIDDVIDVLSDSIVYINAVVALNKIDKATGAEVQRAKSDIEQKLKAPVVPVSASEHVNIDALRHGLFESLGLIRIYLKPKDGEPDFSKPMIMKRGSRVIDIAKGLHSKIASNLRFAFVRGASVKFENQRVGPEHVLSDRDVVTLVYTKS